MNILKQIRLRYYLAKSAQSNLYIIREIDKFLEQAWKEYRQDPNNVDKQIRISNSLDELEKYEGRFGHSILKIFSMRGTTKMMVFPGRWKVFWIGTPCQFYTKECAKMIKTVEEFYAGSENKFPKPGYYEIKDNPEQSYRSDSRKIYYISGKKSGNFWYDIRVHNDWMGLSYTVIKEMAIGVG